MSTTGFSPCCRRFTGKERDAESGLDFFRARYFGSAQGRFTSVDPFDPIMHSENTEQFNAYLQQPQNWNKYSYVWNNPLRYVDPTGAAVELLGDEEERRRALALLQKSVGNSAGGSLYINEVKDGDKTRFFLGIKGDVGQFMKQGETAHDLANLVQDPRVVEFGRTNRNLSGFGGAVTFGPGENGNQNVQVLINPNQIGIGDRLLRSPFHAFSFEGGNQSPRWEPRSLTTEIGAWHEFGHAWGMIHGRLRGASHAESLEWENRMRQQLYGPFGSSNPRRVRH